MIKPTKNQQRYFDIGATFLTGIFSSVLGIILLQSTDRYLFIHFTAYLLLIVALLRIIRAFFHSEKRNHYILNALIEIGIGIFILTFPNFPIRMLSLTFSIYLLLSGIIQAINGFLSKNFYPKLKSFILALIAVIIGIFFFIAFKVKSDISVYFLAGYFILWGISMMANACLDLFFKNSSNPKIRMCLPAIIDAFIPNMWLNRVNKYYSEEHTEKDEAIEPLENEEANLEVFIHASPDGFNTFGHVDVMFEGTLYSYGNYDDRSLHFFSMIGDGIIFMTNNRDAYIRFCLKRCKKTLFVFGIKLNEEEKKRVRNQINQIKKDLVPWDPDFIHQPLEKGCPSLDLHVHQIHNEAKGDLYKLKRGTFKTYYVFTTNCVRFADYIIGNNIDAMKIVGFITPGTYLDYFEGEYKRKSSNVVSKHIYSIHNYDIGEDNENDPYKDFK